MVEYHIKLVHPDGLKTYHCTSSLAEAFVIYREEINRYKNNDRKITLYNAIYGEKNEF